MNKKVFITTTFVMLATIHANAQNVSNGYGVAGIDPTKFPDPTRKIINEPIKPSVNVSYNISSTVLTVSFSSISNGGTVEVYRDGVIVAGISAGGGTTFSCMLNDYGEGDYYIIVSQGNTVVYSKNITIR
ncbi:MAG: hypothetical protein II956_11670 [Bacteroidales bacterium]|nr:hypothetical protein [Bacteroidales bacterium]